MGNLSYFSATVEAAFIGKQKNGHTWIGIVAAITNAATNAICRTMTGN